MGGAAAAALLGGLGCRAPQARVPPTHSHHRTHMHVARASTGRGGEEREQRAMLERLFLSPGATLAARVIGERSSRWFMEELRRCLRPRLQSPSLRRSTPRRRRLSALTPASSPACHSGEWSGLSSLVRMGPCGCHRGLCLPCGRPGTPLPTSFILPPHPLERHLPLRCRLPERGACPRCHVRLDV